MKKYDIKEFAVIPPPYGGVTVFVHRLINRLSEDGYSTGGFYSNENHDKKIRDSTLFEEFNYNPNETKVRRVLNHLQKIKIALSYRIIHFHGLETMFVPWLLMRVYRKKIVITVHSAMIVDFYERTSWLNKFFLSRLAQSNAQWIAVSEQAKKEMYKLPFCFKKNIPVIPAYIPISTNMQYSLPESMSKYIDGHKKNISFYGRSFMKYKEHDVYGFETIIELYSLIVKKYDDEIGLVLCISESSDTDKISGIKQLAKELGVSEKIYWQIGPLDSLQSLWHKTDIYIRPTFTDGDSVAVREAVDAGMAVIASDVCTRPEEVVTYRFDDFEDLYQKTIDALNIQNRVVKTNDVYYNQMKDIYISMLNQ